MHEAIGLLGQWGPWGLLIAAIILVLREPEKVERWRGLVLDLFSWAGSSWRKRAVKADIQATINAFARSVDSEVAGAMPYNVKLEFVTEMDRAELLRKENTVVVRIRDRRHDDKNLVHAALAFCPAGVIPTARPYLDQALSDAVDFTVTQKLLASLQHSSALAYLHKEILVPEMKRNAELRDLCRILGSLDEHGWFTMVVLRELRDFASKVGTAFPEARHRDEAKQFVKYLDAIAKRAPGETCETDFVGVYIAMGFVFVGTPSKIDADGVEPYLQAISYDRAQNVDRIYLCARDWAIETAEAVASYAARRTLAKVIDKRRYKAIDNSGNRREHILIELEPSPAAPNY